MRVCSVVTVTIPPGTQPGTILRLRDKGLPEFRSKDRGDLFLTIKVKVPKKLNPEEKRLYEDLRKLQKDRKKP